MNQIISISLYMNICTSMHTKKVQSLWQYFHFQNNLNEQLNYCTMGSSLFMIHVAHTLQAHSVLFKISTTLQKIYIKIKTNTSNKHWLQIKYNHFRQCLQNGILRIITNVNHDRSKCNYFFSYQNFCDYLDILLPI